MLTDGNTSVMDIPDLVQRTVGDEEIQAGVSLGDEDAVCLTPTRTIVYNGDGLLSDEQVEEFSHDVEQIAVSEGRRKTKFVLGYIEGTESFTVPSNRGDKVLELLLEGVLRLEGVIDERESVVGVYRFSELVLVVCEGRLIKLIGEQVWNDDFEVYPFESVTGLEFERASVATSIALAIDGRPQRVKVPNDNAPVVRQTLEQALFEYYDVGSLEELNRVVGDDIDGTDDDEGTSDLDFGPGIDPLVTDDEDEPLGDPTADAFAADDTGVEPTPAGGDDESAGAAGGAGGDATEDAGTGAGGDASTADAGDAATGGDGSSGTEDGMADQPSATSAAASEGATGGSSAGTGGGTAAGGTAEGASAGPGDGSAEETEGTASTASAEASEARRGAAGEAGGAGAGEGPAASDEELAAVADRLAELTDAVDRQNELLKRQHRAIRQLIEQLQSE